MHDNIQKKQAEKKRIWCPQVSWGKCPSWNGAEEEELAFRKEQAALEQKRLQLEQTRQEQLQQQAQQQTA